MSPNKLSLLLFAAIAISGCRQDMHDQPKYGKPYQPSNFFADGRSERPTIAGTVARGHLKLDREYNYGRVGNTDDVVDRFPFAITKEVLQRGHARYDIYCSPCHGFTGEGNGMIVQRGLSHVPTYHDDRLRNAPVGHFFDVITNGYGAMYSYAQRVPVRDRWAIVAYIRALQLSQNATSADVPPDQVGRLSQPQAQAPNEQNRTPVIAPGHTVAGEKR